MSGRVVSDIQTRPEGDCKILDTNGCKRSYSLMEILEIGMVLGEKIERKVYVTQQNFVSDKIHFFCLFFINY